MNRTTLLGRYAERITERDTSPNARVKRALRVAYFANQITLQEYQACLKVLEGQHYPPKVQP